MVKCNCRVTYESQMRRYVVGLSMIKKGFDIIDMLWDTGAANSIIYSNLLRNIKNVDEQQLNKLEECLNYSEKDKFRAKYKYMRFGSALKGRIDGILCCTHDVYVNHLHLENFYFFILPANETKMRGLLGADFISCCERQASINSDEIFTQFDEELYERKYQNLMKTQEKKPYDLNFLMDTKKETKSTSSLVDISWSGIDRL